MPGVAIRRKLIAPPWLVKLEFTRGCNLSCQFCPIHALPEYSEHKEYLSSAVCQQLCLGVAELAPRVRVELTMRGEPTLNPFLLENVAIIRRCLPESQVSLFTNGVRFFREPYLIPQLLDAGINILNIDCYNRTYDRFARLAETVAAERRDVRIKDFRSFSAYRRHPGGHRLRVINLVPDIAQPDSGVTVRAIHNNAGNSDPLVLQQKWGIQPLSAPLKKNCARPYREAVFTYDGAMVICCHDWRAECVLGRVPASTVSDLWYSEKHLAILRSLWQKDRSGPPCVKCDYHGGYRLGFLRNPFEQTPGGRRGT